MEKVPRYHMYFSLSVPNIIVIVWLKSFSVKQNVPSGYQLFWPSLESIQISDVSSEVAEMKLITSHLQTGFIRGQSEIIQNFGNFENVY